MQDYAIISTLSILIILQTFLIFESLKMKGVVSTESLDLKTELGNLSILVDEAVDYLADTTQASPALQGASGDLKAVILEGIMARMMAGPEHGSKQTQQEERSVFLDEETNIPKEII